MTETKKITVKEFKMWLEGVEEMQDSDWTPTPAQWSRIRAKIDTVDEITAPAVQMHTAPSFAIPRTIGSGGGVQPGQQPQPPAQLPTMQFANVPTGLGGPAPSGPRPPLATSSNGQAPVRTPDIDTSAEPYKSSFA